MEKTYEQRHRFHAATCFAPGLLTLEQRESVNRVCESRV